MSGVSWRPGCPVPLADLRLVTMSHWGFDRKVATGRLVVHKDAVPAVHGAFERLFAAGFPIRRMRPIEAYRGDDYASIEDDNTSAFNCRPRVGSPGEYSQHSFGQAVDLNPLENPYVDARGRTSHPRSVTYLDRSRERPGMILPGGPAVAAFDAVGWQWGGRWSSPTDLQHFSSSGR